MYDEQRRELLDTCLEMLRLDMVIGSSGNASVRVDDRVVITPSSVHYAIMTTEDIVILDLEGNTIEGDRNPSVESPAHLIVYNNREDANAIVHAHSVYASALSLLNRPLPPIIDEVVPKLGGDIRVAKYAMPGTKDLANHILEAIESRSAALMANHGAFCIGKNLGDALHNAQLLERTCKIYLTALQVGVPAQLPEDVVEDEMDLWEMMKEY